MKHLFLFGLTAATLLGVAQAQTASKPTYAWVSVGVSHTDALDPVKSSPGPYEVNSTPMGYRVGLGRRWGPVWSTEASLTDYGVATYEPGEGATSDSHGWVSTRGVAVSSVWRAQTELDITLVTRIGVSYNWTHGVERETGGVDATRNRRNAAPFYGLGMEYALPDDMRIQFTGDITSVQVGSRRVNQKFYALGLSKAF